MCIYNTIIKNRKYTKNKKNNGEVPDLPDRRIEYVPIGCGNCMECRKQKANSWRVRLMEHIKTNKHGKFLTLTFSNESIAELLQHTIKKTEKETGRIRTYTISDLTGYERDNQIATRAVRLWNERWRKQYKQAIKHWLTTELGHNGTNNIHIHGIVWTPEPFQAIRNTWQYGWIYPRPRQERLNYVNTQSVNYIVKYVSKVDQKHKEYKSIILTSPGIGANYINTTDAAKNIKNQKDTYKTTTGHEMALPIYYRNQLYTEQDREELWIKKLNKQERWVDGVKYDISQTTTNYDNAVKDARRKNTALKYGARKNHDRKHYEQQIREIMIQTRIQNTINKNNKTNDNNLTKPRM